MCDEYCVCVSGEGEGFYGMSVFFTKSSQAMAGMGDLDMVAIVIRLVSFRGESQRASGFCICSAIAHVCPERASAR